MDFRKTEIFFVVAFLILDIFLFVTLKTKQNVTYDAVKENTTIVEQMKEDKISIPDNLPSGVEKATYIKAEKMEFTKDIAKELSNEDQYVVSQADGSLYSTVQKQILLTDEGTTKELTNFVHEKAYKGAEYRFFKRDNQNKKIVYVQEYKGIPILDGTAEVMISLKENSVDSASQVLSYEQTYANKVTYLRDGELLVSAQQAIEILYKNDELPADSTITKVDLGYMRMLHLQNSDVYIPAWFVTVEKNDISEQKMVNAIEGKVIQPQKTNEEVEVNSSN
ncbi:two-component system regulatory protein YycI [Isobaculum melis]|uniref:Two-component signal transduction system YycFG, regulatory protein YycI n=1 Tax=Isobaculum melis TaxID=142588 RepID=A0A1H9TTZ8_9LACT|nr:two-component system regulatory protein YycI [Isobaculum melis]SES00508.1 Two-component signal transduction system YycFG, regulatory protein YycI [Isobaculum melis]